MHKLKYKELLTLPKGKYHDGKGLYISISSLGRGKWSYRYRIDSKSREMLQLSNVPSSFITHLYKLSLSRLL